MIMSPAAIEENLEMLYTLSVFYNSCVTVLWIVNVSLSVRNFVISGHNNNDATDIYELYIGVMSSSVLEVAYYDSNPTSYDKLLGQCSLWGGQHSLDRLHCH
jgi:hypothetical protein